MQGMHNVHHTVEDWYPQGESGKMSASDSNSAIFVNDTSAQIKTKVLEASFAQARLDTCTSAHHGPCGCCARLDTCTSAHHGPWGCRALLTASPAVHPSCIPVLAHAALAHGPGGAGSPLCSAPDSHAWSSAATYLLHACGVHCAQINKFAFSGGCVTVQEHREKGANLEVRAAWGLTVSGRQRLTGSCIKYAIWVKRSWGHGLGERV